MTQAHCLTGKEGRADTLAAAGAAPNIKARRKCNDLIVNGDRFKSILWWEER